MFVIFNSCKRKRCLENVNFTERKSILAVFHGLSSKNEQDLHLQRLIEFKSIIRRRPRVTENQHETKLRQACFEYFVLNNNKRVKICRKAFAQLHRVSEKRILRITHLLVKSETPRDKRGTNPKTHCIPKLVCQQIRDHIQSFPTKTTHYSGRCIQYLDARLDVKRMFGLFKDKFPNTKVKYEFYLKFFNENFALRFGRPQIDVCCTCEELSVKIKTPHLSQNVKLAAQADLTLHKRRSKKFFTALKNTGDESKTNPKILGLAFDFMQNLPLPHTPVGEIFYLRQLWVNAFCIHNLKDDNSQIYMYHEGVAKKGANEVCSFIYGYITHNVSIEVTDLYLYSDGCPGQNRNHTMIRMCLALVDNGKFQKIVHRFPVRGHSFLPCDRDFGVFKRKIKKMDRVFLPNDYCSIIANSKKNVTVKMVSTDDILNFSKWWPPLYKKTTLSDDSRGKNVPKDQKISFTPSQFYEFVYSSEHPGKVIAKFFINGLMKNTFDLRQSGQRNICMSSIPQAYPAGNVPINSKKLDNIRQVVKYVSAEDDEARAFYEEILQWPTTEQEVEDE